MKYVGHLGLALLLAGCATQPPTENRAEFAKFYKAFRADVEARGLNPDLLDAAFDGDISPVGAVLVSEKNQPETTLTLDTYLKRILSDTRRTKGAELYRQYMPQLKDIEARTGVPPEVLVALWGVESNFGSNTGGHPIIPALVTLAWKSERSAFFTKEAMAALQVAAQQRMDPRELTGSWAGAMGQCQFMPTTYLNYAMDGDGDGKVDIWTNPVDVLASGGHYLQQLGWKRGVPWRMPAHVTAELPEAAGFNDRGLSKPHSLAQWQRWGVIPRGKSFTALGGMDTPLRLYRPMGGSGPVYMLGPNYDVILRWNMSSYFATSVLMLGDSIANEGALPDV